MAELPQHEYDYAGVCMHCNDRMAENEGKHEGRLCIRPRVVTTKDRPTPPSMFQSADGFDAINKRIIELEAERQAWLATAPLEPMAPAHVD